MIGTYILRRFQLTAILVNDEQIYVYTYCLTFRTLHWNAETFIIKNKRF